MLRAVICHHYVEYKSTQSQCKRQADSWKVHLYEPRNQRWRRLASRTAYGIFLSGFLLFPMQCLFTFSVGKVIGGFFTQFVVDITLQLQLCNSIWTFFFLLICSASFYNTISWSLFLRYLFVKELCEQEESHMDLYFSPSSVFCFPLPQSLYESIKKEPFKIPEDDGNDLMHTFFNPDKEGWLWKQGKAPTQSYLTLVEARFEFSRLLLQYMLCKQNTNLRG